MHPVRAHTCYRILRRAIKGYNKTIFNIEELRKLTDKIEGLKLRELNRLEIELFGKAVAI